MNEDLPDKREFGTVLIRADPLSDQPGESALEYSVTRISTVV
jgi:hypothetical protein